MDAWAWAQSLLRVAAGPADDALTALALLTLLRGLTPALEGAERGAACAWRCGCGAAWEVDTGRSGGAGRAGPPAVLGAGEVRGDAAPLPLPYDRHTWRRLGEVVGFVMESEMDHLWRRVTHGARSHRGAGGGGLLLGRARRGPGGDEDGAHAPLPQLEVFEVRHKPMVVLAAARWCGAAEGNDVTSSAPASVRCSP